MGLGVFGFDGGVGGVLVGADDGLFDASAECGFEVDVVGIGVGGIGCRFRRGLGRLLDGLVAVLVVETEEVRLGRHGADVGGLG